MPCLSSEKIVILKEKKYIFNFDSEMNSRCGNLFRYGHQKLARPFGLTSCRLLSLTRSMNDEEKSFKDRVKILKTNDGYVTMPNWVPLVAIILFVYKAYEHTIENSLALKQLESLAKNSADKIELIDRNNDMNKVQQDVSNSKNIEEILKCQNEIQKLETLVQEEQKKQMQVLESQNRNQDEIKRNMRALFDAIQRLNQVQSQKTGSFSSAARSSTNAVGNTASWFEIKRNIKTKLSSSPQERFICYMVFASDLYASISFALHIMQYIFSNAHKPKTATSLYARATRKDYRQTKE